MKGSERPRSSGWMAQQEVTGKVLQGFFFCFNVEKNVNTSQQKKSTTRSDCQNQNYEKLGGG